MNGILGLFGFAVLTAVVSKALFGTTAALIICGIVFGLPIAACSIGAAVLAVQESKRKQ